MHRRALIAAAAGAAVTLPSVAVTLPTIRTAWPVNAGPLNPHMYSPNQLYAQAMLYEPLVRYGQGGRIETCLATAWSIEDEGRNYVFQLRQGVVFSDGTPFNAASVKANFDAVLANRPRHAWLELAAQIEALEVIDRATVRLRLRDAYYPTLMELSLIRPFRFLSPAAFQAGGTAAGIAAPVGTGPWKLAGTARGEHDTFVRNDTYWGARPAVERIVVRVLPDPTTRALALQSGEIDLLYGTDILGTEAYGRLAHDRRFAAAISPPLASRLLVLNSGRGATAELAVRQAIQHAFNRAALVRDILLDTEAPAETLFAANFPYTNVPLPPYAFDRSRAATLLDSAGWVLAPGARIRTRQGQPLSFDLSFIGTEALQKSVAEVVQSDLARIGIAVRLVGEDASSFYARQKSGQFGMIFGNSWGAPYDPHAFLASMRAPAHADWQAQSGLAMKPAIDRRIGEVLVSTTEAARSEGYAWLLRRLHEQAVYLPISYLTNKLVHRSGLGAMPFGDSQYEIPFDRLSLSA
jgi:nickel transport system substrate-binding protein